MLALSPAFAYMIAYRFEVSYLAWYGVPSDLIELSLDHLVFAWTPILGIVLTILFFVGELPAWPWHTVITRLFTFVMFAGGLWITIPSLGLAHGRERVIFIVVAAVVALAGLLWFFLNLVVPLIARREESWLARLASHDAEFQEKKPAQVKDLAIDRISPVVIWISAIGFLGATGLILANHLGGVVARVSGRYLVAEEDPECAVIRRYGGHLLCLEIDRTGRRFGRRLRVIPVEGAPVLRIEYLRLAPPLEESLLERGPPEVRWN